MDNDFLIENPLAQLDLRLTIPLFLLTIIMAYGIAWRYKDYYDISKILKAYGGYSLFILMANFFLEMKVSIILGVLLMGLIAMGFRSNHYFYN